MLAFHKIPLYEDTLLPEELALSGFTRILDELLGFVRVLPLDEIVAGLASGRMPANAVAITFDDGYDSWAHGVVPLLRDRNVPATFFITTGQLTGEPLWHERIAHAVTNTACPELRVGMHRLPVRTAQERRLAASALLDDLKYRSLSDRMMLIEALEEQAGVTPIGLPRMDVQQLKDIQAAGFSIGAHSVNHPILTCVDGPEAMQEIGRSREVLQGLLGDPIPFFAYPNGRAGRDYAKTHVDLVRRLGFKAAVTTDAGVVHAGTPALEIPRFSPWSTSAVRLRLQLIRNHLMNGRIRHESR